MNGYPTKKQKHKDSYKSTKTELIAINHLFSEVKGSVEVATSAIMFSMAKRYKGIVVKDSTIMFRGFNNTPPVSTHKPLKPQLSNEERRKL